MKLFLNKTSPYARMTRIVVLEKGLEKRVALYWCDPWNDDEQLLAENPVGRIPVLITDQGTALSESLLIAGYLNEQQPTPSLVPEDRKEQVLHRVGLGQGLMDASFTTVISRKHLDAQANGSVLSQRRSRAIDRTLEQLDRCINRYSSDIDITLGDISVAVALEYLAFRLPETAVADRYPNLEAWRNAITQRTSFMTTPFS